MILARPIFMAAAVAFAAVAAPSYAVNGVPKPDHIVVVIEENHSYDEIIGSPSAPYINALAQEGASFTNSHAIEHPSQPNYLDLFSGSNQGVTSDAKPAAPFDAPNLGGELVSAGYTFAAYSEHLPAVGSDVNRINGYARKHCPWANFTVGKYAIPPADCMPFEGWFPGTTQDRAYAKLPTVSFIVPDLQDDMHDGTIQEGDDWLQKNIDGYAQWCKTHNSLLIVTFDENDSHEGEAGNQIVTIFVGPMVHAGQYSEKIDHYALLRTVEDAYGLAYAGSSGSASSITDAWSAGGQTASR